MVSTVISSFFEGFKPGGVVGCIFLFLVLELDFFFVGVQLDVILLQYFGVIFWCLIFFISFINCS